MPVKLKIKKQNTRKNDYLYYPDLDDEKIF